MTTPAQRLARELADYGRRLRSVERASQMSRRSLDNGSVKVFDAVGTLRGIIGLQPDGTNAVVTVNDPVPPTPSAPILEPVAGGLAITWDGTFVDGAYRPSDVRLVNVHVSPGIGAFTPSDVTLRASLLSGGTLTVDLPADPYSVAFVAETTGHTTSAPSLIATDTPAPLGGVDQDARDLAAVAINSANSKVRYITSATKPDYSGDPDTAVWIDTANGRRLNRWNGTDFETQQFGTLALQPGSIVASDVLAEGTVTAALIKGDAIDGKTITGATVRTAASGERVEITTANGFVGYTPAGGVGVQVKNGAITVNGGTITGATYQTAASGGRVRVYQNGTAGIVEMHSGVGALPPAVLQTLPNTDGDGKQIVLKTGTGPTATSGASPGASITLLTGRSGDQSMGWSGIDVVADTISADKSTISANIVRVNGSSSVSGVADPTKSYRVFGERSPVVAVINGTGGTWASPGPITAHGSYTINPASLFGPGFGALVMVEATSVAISSGNWNLEMVSPALSSTVMTSSSTAFAGQHATMRVTDKFIVPAGSTRSISTRYSGGTANLVTYGDATHNRMKLAIHPIYPSN